MASEGFEAISLQSILDNDEAAIKAVNQAWTDRGYCWVDLRTLEKEESAATEKALKRLVAIRKWTARSAIKDLDNLADSDNVRVLQRGKAFGIVRAGHKTSFRILTGPLAKHFPGPKALGEHVQQLAKLTDEIMRRLIERFALPIFGAEDAQAFCDAHELPLGVRGGYHEEDRAGSPKRARFGMLDLALYHNVPADDKKKGAFRARSGYLTENDLNCADHHDPGLFTLSFLSTAPGLELYDWSRQRWEAAPSGPESHFAILWTGGAAVDATSGRLRPGRHRVTFEQAAGPRLAIWHEVCTLGQVHLDTDIAEMDKKLDGEGLFLPNVGESGILLTKEPLVPMATSHSAPERLFGLPISKVLRPKPLSPFKAEPELGVAISKVPAPATSWEAITAAFQAKERVGFS